MSTPSVRATVLADLIALVAPTQVFNMSDYVSLSDLPVSTTGECMLVDFVASNDQVMTIGGEGNQGWRESGTVVLTWLCPTGFDSDPILVKVEQFRKALRGKRLGNNIVIESAEPFADSGSPVDINGAWTGYTSVLFYTKHDCG